MPQFQLTGAHAPQFTALDDFTRGYIEAAFFTDEERLEEEGLEAPGVTDLAPETFSRMVADCQAFLAKHAALLDKAECSRGAGGYSKESQAGHDFWLTRNGHGCGFWDGDWSEPEDVELTKAAQSFGQCDLYVGDDQLIYCM